MSGQQVAKCCRSFQAGREHVENRNMEASGRPSSSRTDINTARVEEIIQMDRRVTVLEIASELDLNYGNVQRIVTDELRYSKTFVSHTVLNDLESDVLVSQVIHLPDITYFFRALKYS
ncbi:histone-lysine N-methyltransferase SETMAR [Nephila pilipes]|uniref:Histone-lysine N-methyltransferase SETMAR n=1 Tax=Nephila pilipes TaxID=299642 RepID=A0A8X6TQV2_NEPPI|nr:histone-lysine N-methyltransferase SETMAR [Nephila pilipes]